MPRDIFRHNVQRHATVQQVSDSRDPKRVDVMQGSGPPTFGDFHELYTLAIALGVAVDAMLSLSTKRSPQLEELLF